MANYSMFLTATLVMALFLSLLKIHTLNQAVQEHLDDKSLMIKDLNKLKDQNYVMEQRMKKETEDRGGVEMKLRNCYGDFGKQKVLLTNTQAELDSKIKAHDSLFKKLAEAQQELEVKKNELVKVAEESAKYRDLYKKENNMLNDLRNSYDTLKKQVAAREDKKGNAPESVVKRETEGGSAAKDGSQNKTVPEKRVTEKVQEKQASTPPGKTKANQEQTVNTPQEEENAEQQEEEEEEAVQEEGEVEEEGTRDNEKEGDGERNAEDAREG